MKRLPEIRNMETNQGFAYTDLRTIISWGPYYASVGLFYVKVWINYLINRFCYNFTRLGYIIWLLVCGGVELAWQYVKCGSSNPMFWNCVTGQDPWNRLFGCCSQFINWVVLKLVSQVFNVMFMEVNVNSYASCFLKGLPVCSQVGRCDEGHCPLGTWGTWVATGPWEQWLQVMNVGKVLSVPTPGILVNTLARQANRNRSSIWFLYYTMVAS